jgi:hypothetical protein
VNAPPRGRTLEVVEDALRRRELAMDHQTPPTRYWKGMRERKLLHRPQKWGGRRVEGAEEVLEKERVDGGWPTHRQPRKLRRRKRKALVGR